MTTRATRNGDETRDQFRNRLRNEGRWKAYSDERKVLMDGGASSTEAHNAMFPRYAPGTASGDGDEDEDTGDTTFERMFKDRLPNGCPLFDRKLWKGKPATNLLDDVQWVASHLGLKDFDDFAEQSPSIRSCTLYWEARYTAAGMARYQELLRQLEIPDKATLKQLNNRKDDGAELGLLEDFLENYTKHEEEQA